MGSTASFVVPNSYTPIVYKYPPNKSHFQEESAHSSARDSRLELVWETTLVICSHWTVPRLQNPVVCIYYCFDQIILKENHVGKEAHLSFPLASLVNDTGNDKAKCGET